MLPASPAALQAHPRSRLSPLAAAQKLAPACAPQRPTAGPQLASTRSSIAGRTAGLSLSSRSSAAPVRPRRPVCPMAGPGDEGVIGDRARNEVDKTPPTILWRVFAAAFYLIPWCDIVLMGRPVFRRFFDSILLYFIPGPVISFYFSNQHLPLILFFAQFLMVVKNKKIHHFVRFNCMQALMVDIITMLFLLLEQYIPAEVKWTVLIDYFNIFAWVSVLSLVGYAIFWTLRGFYAEIPFISESAYHQVGFAEMS